ncbi:hypothetical protein VPH35_083261 [Triticum aestivum]
MAIEGEQQAGGFEEAALAGSSTRSTSHTSRIVIQKVVEVVATLSDYKRFLVEEIGFEGVLRIPMIPKINLKFSKFLMSKVDLKDHCIILRDGGKPIKFHPEDFHKVFGIPCGQRDIHGTDAHITNKSDRSLSSLEAFICKEINELSSRLEKDCFKMAFVVFVMGNLFAPYADNIALFNWCKYSFEGLLEAVRKLKLETDADITLDHLSGCHLFLQVFVLDNVELGIMNLKQTTMPRIQLFDGATLKWMILVCSARKLGKTIFIVPEARHWNAMCYTWHNYQNEIHMKKKAIETKAERSANQYTIEEQINPDIAIGHLTQTPSSNVDFSPGDYARWIQMQNPELAASPLGWALKEHNAKCVHIANEMKRNIANQNNLIVLANQSDPSVVQVLSRPHVICSYAPPFDLDIDGDSEASTPIKKDGNGSPLSPTAATKAYCDNLVGQLMMLNDEIGDTEGHTVFGQVNGMPIIKTKVAHTKFTEDPWSSNRTMCTHGEVVRKAIRDWMRSRTQFHLSRDWVSHPAPRFIAVSGNAIKSQICDGAEIDHELGSLIIRRMAQMESHAHRATPDEQYRLILEPDFSSHAIAGENTTRIMSIQRQSTRVDVKCNISNCRMVTIPAVMQHGWSSFN